MFDIKDIYKTKNEKELVTTFAEPFMFSFKVKNNDEYFLMGTRPPSKSDKTSRNHSAIFRSLQ